MVISPLQVSEILKVSINMKHWLKFFTAIKSLPVNGNASSVEWDTKRNVLRSERGQVIDWNPK